MKQIWAPWRIEYIQMEKVKGCILCEKPRQNSDVQNYILHRGEKASSCSIAIPITPVT